MTFQPPKKYVALAIDGGGMKGLMVAQALIKLEEALVGDRPLIACPNLKILVGTSTGAIIAASLAMGMRARDIARLYVEASHKVFPPLDPDWCPKWLRMGLYLIRGLIQPSQYSDKGLVELLQEYIGKYLGKPDVTLAELNTRLAARGQSIIITTAEIGERRTHFLKSHDPHDGDWELWKAVLASSSAPTVFPVVLRPQQADHYYTDGGVGAQGNPADIAVQEAIDWYKLAPSEVTVFSFGTGWLDTADYLRISGKPTGWRLPEWAMNGPNLIIFDVARAQSVQILYNYQPLGLDFRRFQVRLADDFDPFAAVDENNKRMVEIGNMLGERILLNQHALYDPSKSHPDYDPEGLVDALAHYTDSRQRGRNWGMTLQGNGNTADSGE